MKYCLRWFLSWKSAPSCVACFKAAQYCATHCLWQGNYRICRLRDYHKQSAFAPRSAPSRRLTATRNMLVCSVAFATIRFFAVLLSLAPCVESRFLTLFVNTFHTGNLPATQYFTHNFFCAIHKTLYVLHKTFLTHNKKRAPRVKQASHTECPFPFTSSSD